MAPTKPLTNKSLKRRLRRVENYVKQLQYGEKVTVKSDEINQSTSFRNIFKDVYPNPINQTLQPIFPNGNSISSGVFVQSKRETIQLKTLQIKAILYPRIDPLSPPNQLAHRKYRLTCFYVYRKKLNDNNPLVPSIFFDDPNSILSQIKTENKQEKTFTTLYDEIFNEGSIVENETSENGGSKIITKTLFINRKSSSGYASDHSFARTTEGIVYLSAMAEGGTNATGGCGAFRFSFTLSYIG